MGPATKEKVRQFIARIERVESEQSELAADKTEIYAEVKTFGLDPKIMRKVIALRKLDASERAEQEAMLDLYLDVAEGDFEYDTAPAATPKVDAILMNMDGSRETIKVDMLVTNLMHNGKLYLHYTENAYKQV